MQRCIALADEDKKVILAFLNDPGTNKYIAKGLIESCMDNLRLRALSVNEKLFLLICHEDLLFKRWLPRRHLEFAGAKCHSESLLSRKTNKILRESKKYLLYKPFYSCLLLIQTTVYESGWVLSKEVGWVNQR